MDRGNAAHLSPRAPRCLSGYRLWNPQGLSADLWQEQSGKANYRRYAAQTGRYASEGGALEAVALGGQLVPVAGLRTAANLDAQSGYHGLYVRSGDAGGTLHLRSRTFLSTAARKSMARNRRDRRLGGTLPRLER